MLNNNDTYDSSDDDDADSELNEIWDKINEVVEEQTAQRELINALQVLPEKTEYLNEKNKKDLVEMLEITKKENKSEIQEFRDYVNSLHTDIQFGVTQLKAVKEMKAPTK